LVISHSDYHWGKYFRDDHVFLLRQAHWRERDQYF